MTAGNRWTYFGVRVLQNIGLSNRGLKAAQYTPVLDRQTDEHHGNSVTIRSMNASRANNTAGR